MGASTSGIISGRSLPSPSMESTIEADGETAAMPASIIRP
jgi:hypothetical protein